MLKKEYKTFPFKGETCSLAHYVILKYSQGKNVHYILISVSGILTELLQNKHVYGNVF